MLAGGPGRGVSLPPPVEPLLVARRTPLSQVKKAAEQHMAGIYAMLENWQVGHCAFLASLCMLLVFLCDLHVAVVHQVYKYTCSLCVAYIVRHHWEYSN